MIVVMKREGKFDINYFLQKFLIEINQKKYYD